MIERVHLQIIAALAENGSLTAAANALFVTQSALSHQIRYLENKLEIPLWQREGRKLRLTRAGELLLQVAGQVLPVFEQTEQTLKAYAGGRAGILRLGVECHPCYEWLKGVLGDYLRAMPAMDVDIRHQFQFSGMQALLNQHVDLLVTPDKLITQGIRYAPLMDYELVLVVANAHPLATKSYVKASDLAAVLLLTFPVAPERLDVFSHFLQPAGVLPDSKQIQSLEIMLQMVILNRGVTVLPDWLARELAAKEAVSICRLGSAGLPKTLFAAIREADAEIEYIQEFIALSRRHQLGSD